MNCFLLHQAAACLKKRIYTDRDRIKTFLKKVVKNKKGCLIWQPKTMGFWDGKIIRSPKRFAYQHGHPGCNIKNLNIVSACGDPRCVNPDHLVALSKKEHGNIIKFSKNCCSGEKVWCSKLTRKQVESIRKEYKWGKGPALAKKYGIALDNVYNIIHNRTWKLKTKNTSYQEAISRATRKPKLRTTPAQQKVLDDFKENEGWEIFKNNGSEIILRAKILTHEGTNYLYKSIDHKGFVRFCELP